MDDDLKGLVKIREILQSQTSGMTIIDIAVEAGISRNTAAKRLNVLLASGQVEMKTVGPAKLYFLSNRVPFSSLMNSTSDSIVVLNETLHIVQVNDRFLELFAIGLDEVIGKAANTLSLSLFSDSQMLSQFKRAAEGSPFSAETKLAIQNKDYYLDIKLIPTAFENGAPAVTAILEDISKRKEAENEIQRQHRFLDRAVESLTHPFYLINADDYTILMANKVAHLGPLTGNQTCYELTHRRNEPCEGSVHPCPLIEVKRTKKPVVTEHVHYDNEHDRNRILEVHGYPILDDEGNVVQMIEYNLDITENREAYAEIKVNEAKFRSIFENALVGIARVDPNGILLEANQRLAQVMGFDQHDLVGVTMEGLSHPKDYALERKLNQEIIEGFRESYTIEKRFKRKDGKIIWGRIDVSASRDYQGEICYFVNMIEDITKSHHIMEYLRTQYTLMLSLNERITMQDAFRNVLKAALSIEGVDSGGIYLLNESSGSLDLVVHEGFSEEFLIDIEKFNAESPQTTLVMSGRIIYGDYANEFHDIDCVDREGLFGSIVIPTQYNGRIFGALNLTSHTDESIPEYSKQFIEMLSSLVGEIWAREKALEKLYSSEARFRSIFENTEIGLAIVDLSNSVLSVNHKYSELVGYDHQELLGMNITQITHPDDMEKDADLFSRIVDREIDSYHIEKRLIQKNGEQIWVDLTATNVRSPSGQVDHIVRMVENITDRKNIEESLKNREEKYRHLFETNRDGIVFTAMDGTFIEANPAFLKMTGYTLDELRSIDYHQLTPKEWDSVESKIHDTQVLVQDYSDEYEKEYFRKDGTVFPAVIRTWLVRDDQKNPSHIIASVRDITETKKAQEALKETDELYRKTLESISDILFVVDKDLRIVLVNPNFSKWCDEVGISNDAVNKTIPKAFPFLPMSFLNEYTQIFNSGESILTTISPTISDERYSLETIKIPILNKGQVTQVLTVMRKV